MASHLKSNPNITLYRGFQASGVYAWSPFVTKLEARLRFAGLPYRAEPGSIAKAPRGKIPYVAISKPEPITTPAPVPTVLGDTAVIIQQFVDDGLLLDLNAKLSPVEKAHDLALRALLEDKQYFYQTHERWNDNYYTMRSQILAALPYPIQVLVGLLAYRKMSSYLYGQGTGRFSADELSLFKQQVWENINALAVESRRKTKLGGGADDAVFWIWGGSAPSEADAVLFGFIASVLVSTANPESQKVVKGFPTVIDYARRIHNRYFPDYVCWEE